MSIRRRCRGTCRSSRRCLEHLWFDVTHDGKRFRMPVNDFAVPRMEPGKQRSIESMEEARDWERLFIGEIKAGRDPQLKPVRKEKAPDIKHVAGFLDAYFDGHLKPAGIRSLDTAAGRLKVLKQYFGDLPVKALEEPAVINRFKAESEYAARGGDRHAAQGAGALAGIYPLGTGADAAAHRQVALPPFRCPAEREGGDGARSAALTRRGEAAPRRGRRA